MNKTLFSFGNWRYYLSLDALKQSALDSAQVNRVILLKEPDIDVQFYQKNSLHFKNGRGFGYWIWKSYFINKFLETASNNDIFMYADAGNLVIKDLTPLYTLCADNSKGIILFENTDGEPNGNIWKNNLWTKSDCFNIMGLKSDEYFFGNQVNASYIVFRKTDFSINFFKNFMEYCENYNIISNAPNITEDFNKDFRDHRHDQSILSLLSIACGINIYRDPSEWGNHKITGTSEYQQLFYHHRRKYLS